MILLVNGPNLNLLGEREPEIYGREHARRRGAPRARGLRRATGVEVLAFQSNWEGALLDFLQAHRREAEGVIVNPGALTHTSRALHDCLRALSLPDHRGAHLQHPRPRGLARRERGRAGRHAGRWWGSGVAGYRYAALELCARVGARPQAEPEGKAEPWQATSLAQPVVAATPAPPPPPAAKEPATSSVNPAAPSERPAAAEHPSPATASTRPSPCLLRRVGRSPRATTTWARTRSPSPDHGSAASTSRCDPSDAVRFSLSLEGRRARGELGHLGMSPSPWRGEGRGEGGRVRPLPRALAEPRRPSDARRRWRAGSGARRRRPPRAAAGRPGCGRPRSGRPARGRAASRC